MREWWEHGGLGAAYEEEYGEGLLDLSANVSPLGIPDGVKRAAAAALLFSDRYPDPFCTRLRKALSEKLSVPKEWILCGNGASDLIYRFALSVRPRKAWIPAPSFSEYRKAVELSGGEAVLFFLSEERDFAFPENPEEEIGEDIDAVFLCSPHNPTGRVLERDAVRRVLSRCREIGARLFLDECFLDFLPEPERYSLLGEADPRLLILRAFTKSHGMAGIRLGYCVCRDEELLRRMREAGPPWSVSCVAEEAGIAALREEEYLERLRRQIAEERPGMRSVLESAGFHVVPGEANFLLFKARPSLSEELLSRGILIRSCGSFPGLSGEWFRVAVRGEAERERLAEALGKPDFPVAASESPGDERFGAE